MLDGNKGVRNDATLTRRVWSTTIRRATVITAQRTTGQDTAAIRPAMVMARAGMLATE